MWLQGQVSPTHAFIGRNLIIVHDIVYKAKEEKDWNVLIIEIHSYSLQAQWNIIAALLGLKDSLIDSIKENNPNNLGCWYKVLSEWIIHHNYDTKTFGLPSWKTFLKAVAQVDPRLFKTLARHHLSKPLSDTCAIKFYAPSLHVHDYLNK